jgi:TrmH family RNA methyltransferase
MSSSEKIESPQNLRLKAIARLRTSRGRKRQTHFLVDGVRETLRAISAGQFMELVLVCRDHLDEGQQQQVLAACQRASIEVVEASPRAFAKVAFGQREEGVVGVARATNGSLAEWRSPVPGSIYLVLESVEKPGNLGAIFRTADAFGVAGILLTDPVVLPENPNAIRASLGTVFSVPYVLADCAAARAWLDRHSIRVYAARVQAARAYWDVDFFSGRAESRPEPDSPPPSVAMVLGSEAQGLTEVWQGSETMGVSIPQRGMADSLNLSVAAAVLVSEMARQRQMGRGERST